MQGSRSRRVSPSCSMRNLMVSTGSAGRSRSACSRTSRRGFPDVALIGPCGAFLGLEDLLQTAEYRRRVVIVAERLPLVADAGHHAVTAEMLALANGFLVSGGVRHFASSASSYQLRSGPRASSQPPRVSQTFFRLLLTITLMTGKYLPSWETGQRTR
jgi:hypothetical protein